MDEFAEVGAMERFRNKCLIEYYCLPTRDGKKECYLDVSCQVMDKSGRVHQIQRHMAMTPIINAIVRRLSALHAQMHGGSVEVSGFGDLWKRATRVARGVAESKALKQVYEGAKEVYRSPLADVAASFVPGGTAGLQGARMAEALIDKARKGDPKATAQVADVKMNAQAGDPQSAMFLQMMQTLYGVMKTKEAKASPQVAGWWYNRPYRTSAAAAADVISPAVPRTFMREMYNRGMRT